MPRDRRYPENRRRNEGGHDDWRRNRRPGRTHRPSQQRPQLGYFGS